MRLLLFAKALAMTTVAALLYYALTPVPLEMLFKALALGVAGSMVVAVFYPDLRGVKNGDRVVVASNSAVPFFLERVGQALSEGRKNGKIRIRLGRGEEAVGIIEKYEGLVTPPRVRLIYEEKISE